MAKIVLNYDGNPNGAKYKRSLEAFALQQGKTPEEIMEPIMRGIAQQVGLDANDSEEDQEASLAKAERKGARAKQAREDRASEAARLASEAASPKTEPTPTTK
jgi:hypothetical protein